MSEFKNKIKIMGEITMKDFIAIKLLIKWEYAQVFKVNCN